MQDINRLNSGDDFVLEGIVYDFGLDVFKNNPTFHLRIRNFTRSNIATSTIEIEDEYGDGSIDDLVLYDWKNNTSIRMHRTPSNEFEVKGIDESGAKKLYELYSNEYLDFLARNAIMQRIRQYHKKFEITQVIPDS